MYTRLLVPLDGSKTAEKVLPYTRFIATKLKLPVELLEAIDVVEIAKHLAPEKVHLLDRLVENRTKSSERYLKEVAGTLPGANVKCTIEKGIAADVIIENSAADKSTLVSLATHGRSGIERWLLGSVAEKVLRGAPNPMLLIRATDEAKTEGEANLRSVIVPLDGSELAEQVLPTVAEWAKELRLEIILFRTYTIPLSVLTDEPEGGYGDADEQLINAMQDEAVAYLQKKTEALKKLEADKVDYNVKYGLAADEIISLGRKTPDSLIAMCTHGHSGVKRWVLGSVTETVVRHSNEPVLVIRAT